MNAPEYRSISDGTGRLCLRSSRCAASAAEPVAFDCDGVLVDTSASYDAAIIRTAEMLLRMRFGRSPSLGESAGRMIFGLRKTGAFNNDWDSTFAIMLISSLAMLETKNGVRGEHGVARRTEELVGQFSGDRVKDAVRDVMSYAVKIAGNAGARELEEIARWLSYPGVPPGSFLATVFDELYYGEDRFVEFYGIQPRYCRGEGLIRKERLLFDAGLMENITARSGRKPAIITGRPALGTRMSLGKLLDLFDLGSSVFVGDLDYSAAGTDRTGTDELRKPMPGALLKCMKAIGSDSLIYVGDSAEDLQMAASARERGYAVSFAGVCGRGETSAAALDFFMEEGADMIMQDISQLPQMLSAGVSVGGSESR